MKFSPDVQKRLLSALVARLPEKRLVCPLCKHETWILTNGFISHPLQQETGVYNATKGTALVAAAISCTNCGNTHLLNVLVMPEVRELFQSEGIIDDDIKVDF